MTRVVPNFAPARRAMLVPLIVATALFMENLDATVISTALPAMARDLGDEPLRLNLAITSYLLSLAVFIPVSGYAADRFGARTVFQGAIAVFALGSMLCGVAPSLWVLVLARVIQGAGGALMVPVGRLVILRAVPKEELVGAMAYFTIPALIGPLIGPPLGGAIITFASWRWIFFINLPIALLGILLARRFIPNDNETVLPQLDLIGLALVGTGLAGTMFGFESIGRGALPIWIVAGTIAIGGAAIVLFGLHARRVSSPLLDLTLMRLPCYRASVLGGFCFRISVGAMPLLVPLLLQIGFGLSALGSGLITFAGAAGALLMKPASRPILRRLGFRAALIVSSLASAAFFASYAWFRPDTPHAVLIGLLFIGGFFRSLQFTALNTLAYAEVPATLMSRASTLASVGQQLSFALGAGLAALLIHAQMAHSGEQSISAATFPPAFLFVAAMGAVATLWYLPLARDAGAVMTGQTGKQSAAKPVAAD